MNALFVAIRLPVYLLGAAGLVLLFPIYVVIVVAVLVLRILFTPFALIRAAMGNNEYAFRSYMETTKAFPWFGEYGELWVDLNRWLRAGKR